MKLILILLAFVASAYGDCEINGKSHKTGDSATEGKIIFECLENGRKPIACSIQGQTIKPGDKWKSDYKKEGGFVFECVDTGKLTMSLNVISCIAPNGQEFKVGDKIDVEGFGLHSCDKKSDIEVSMKSGKGCEEKGNLVKVDEFVTEGIMKKVCVYRSNNYTMEAYSCVFPDNQEVRVGTYAMINQDFYKCTADLIDLSKSLSQKINTTSCGVHNGTSRKLLDEWTEGNVTYRCLFNVTTNLVFTVITKCHTEDGVEILAGEIGKNKKGDFYYCSANSGVYMITTELKYCKLPDGSKLEVTSEKDVDNVRYKCSFNGTQAVMEMEGCLWNGKEVIAYGNHTKLAKGVAYKCESVEGKFKMVKMSEKEYQIAFDLEQKEISAHGGRGAGNTEEPEVTTGNSTTPNEELSTQKEEPSTQKEESTTHKEETSTLKEEPSTQKEEHSTQKEEHSTPKEEHSTPKEEHSTPNEEHSTQKEEHSTPKEEHSTQKLTTLTEEPSTVEEVELSTKKHKPTIEFNVDTTVGSYVAKTTKPCLDVHEMCEKYGHICNPAKFKKHHRNHHSSFHRSSHRSDESCDWSEEEESKEDRCQECNKKLEHLKKAHIKLIKQICPQTCGCGCEYD